MHWLFAGLAGIGFVELLIRLPISLTLTQLRTTASRVSAILTSRKISDHWKEKALPKYALRLFNLTMLLGVYIIVAFIPFILLSAVSIAIGVPFLQFTLSLTGILFMTILSTGYAKVRFACVTTKL